MKTMSFKGVNLHTAVPGAALLRVKRPVKPEVTRHRVEVPGKKGSYDFGGGVARDYPVEVVIFLKTATSELFRQGVNQLAAYLDDKGALVFSDELGKTHQAQVFSLVAVEETVAAETMGEVTIVFECDA